MRKTTKVMAPFMAASLVLAACGGDDEDSGDEGSTEESSDDEGSGDEGSGDEGSSDEGSGEEASGEPIKVGIIADYTGAFAGLVTEIAEAQKAYFADLNANGGIGGRPVEVVDEDAEYDVALTQEKYAILREEVDMISLSTGSPHTASIQEDLVEDNLLALPLSWYSGWAFEESAGKNVYENYTNYCIESMNGLEYLSNNEDVESIAIVSFPGEYGGDGAAGAAIAAEELGLEVVYDGTGQVTPPSGDNRQPDQSAVISEIVSANPDAVWATVNPEVLGSLMGGAAAQGFEGLWSGNTPTYSYKLLDTEAAPLLDASYIQMAYTATWGTDVPGMENLMSVMAEEKPDLPVSDAYILGWTQALTATAIMEKALEDGGEVNRDTIAAAAADIEISYDGLAPTQTWAGDPNEFVVRESYIYDVSTDAYEVGTVSGDGGGTGSVLLEGPYTGEVAANYDFTEPCYTG